MRVLVVDDELSMREYLELLLVGAGLDVVLAADEAEALAIIANAEIDLVISDMRLGKGSGLNVLKAARSRPQPPEVILITAFGTPAAAVEAMREGAYDYICKPFDNEELRLLATRALEKRCLVEENRQLRLSIGSKKTFWIGESPVMRAVWNLIDKVAPSRTTVLITGESGTGKELIARALHQRSPRAGSTFQAFNCAALSEGVLESELFGHVKGAFTGATSDRPGLLVSAGDGTLFLDEIGEMPLATQVKLLRVLQERTVKPVGGAHEVEFHARIVAATNRHLEEEVRENRFREDLYYRLNVISIDLPPLRERKEDIEILANAFLAEFREELGRPSLQFSEETLQILKEYRFPGNVRQLRNVVERAANLAEDGKITPDALPPLVRGKRVPNRESGEAILDEGLSLEHHLDAIERRYLVSALQRSSGVKTRAAQLLGLTFRSFRYRLAKHGLGDRDELND